MRFLLVPLLASLFFAPAGVAAQSQTAKFKVKVLLASKQGDRVDPQIPKSVRKYLKKSFGARYSSFRLLDSRVLKVGLGHTEEMALPDQSILKLKFRGLPGEFIKLTMEIEDLRTTIRIKNGGMFFQAGHRYKNGMLILAISATTGDIKGKAKIGTARPDPRPRSGDAHRKDRKIDSK